jgi:hypothetical protein
MDSTTVMWLILGGSMLLVGSMQLVLGLFGEAVESGQRTLSILSAFLLGGLAFYVLVWFAAERTTSATLNLTIWGTIIAGVVTALAVLARRRPID